MSKKEDIINQIIDNGVDIVQRRVYFGSSGDAAEEKGEFNWQNVELTIRGLHALASINNNPIELHMNSPGGSVTDMLRLYDEILTLPCKVIFIGGGEISSSATWVMCACDYRKLHKHTNLVLHDGFESLEDRHTDFRIYADHTTKVMEDMYQMYEDNSIMSADFWSDICQRDVPLSAEEAVRLGLADEVIPVVKRGNFRKSRTNKMKKAAMDDSLDKFVKDLYKRIKRVKSSRIKVDVTPQEFDEQYESE